MHEIIPKKSLGQHFLKDKNIARKIVNSLTNNRLPVLEVGPGKGVLTKLLVEKGCDLFAIEIDKHSYNFLVSEFPRWKERIILDDFLAYDLRRIGVKELNIIGNFPYNISSQILFKVIGNRAMVKEVVCMVQKEVAQRISAGPGTKLYGILSVLLQAYYKVEYLFTVRETVFDPPPNVKSAVIRLNRVKSNIPGIDEGLLKSIVKTGFNKRRKILNNSLKSILVNLNIETGLLKKRPEQLTIEEFILLTGIIQKKRDSEKR